MPTRREFLTAAAAALVARRLPAAEADRPPSPADAVRAALADARAVEAVLPGAAARLRYLSAHHVHDADELAELYAVTSLHVNGISRKGFIVRPRKVTAWLWRLDLDDYGLDPVTYANAFRGNSPLATEPYFHDYLVAVDPKTKAAVKTPAAARWLPAAAALELGTLTDSPAFASIARADWLIHRTWADQGRDGFGYTAQLGLKSRADVDRLAGLDRTVQATKFVERLAKVRNSGVSLLPREVERLQGATGPVWRSKDVRAETLGQGDRSALRLLFEDYRHQAEEGVFSLPNGLPGFYLSDQNGVFAATAPDDVATNTKAASNDARVGFFTCYGCHVQAGLIAFDDLNRRPGRLPAKVADRQLYDRTRSAYYREFKGLFDDDVKRFAAAIKDACGLTPAALSEAVKRQWSRYVDRRITPAVAAAEVGLPEAEFTKRLREYAAAAGVVDPILGEFVQADPDPLRREEFEELMPLLMTALGAAP